MRPTTSTASELDLMAIRRVHLIGVGGTAMTPLATILLQMGVSVSGSDLVDGPGLNVLRSKGARVFIGHRADHVEDVELVIVSSAVPVDNVEAAAGRERGIPVVKHSVALGSLMARRRGVAVAGTHGKTTTSGLAAFVLDTAGLEPTFHVGAELLNFGLFGRYGAGEWLVAEADEFDHRFLDLEPEAAIVTAVEPDHLDYFGNFSAMVSAYEAFLTRVRPGGCAILCWDDPVARALPVPLARRVTYGWGEGADWRVVDWRPLSPTRSRLTVRCSDGACHELETGLLGRHNASNACAVVTLCVNLGVPWERVAQGLAQFRGTRRRFEIVGAAGRATIVDDYAHHPTEIRATLAAARAHYGSETWAVFQPHTAHRTLSLFDDFCRCFDDADHVIIVPTYRPPGREPEADDPTVRTLVGTMSHPDARQMSIDAAIDTLVGSVADGDLVLIMGAGDVWKMEQRVVAGLEGRIGSHG